MALMRSPLPDAETRSVGGICATGWLLLICLLPGGCSKSGSGSSGKPVALDPNIFNRHLQQAMADGLLAKMDRGAFDDRDTVDWFLAGLVGAYYKRGPVVVGCARSLGIIGNPAERAQGTGLTEASFRELFKNPAFVFEGNKWTVEFNVFGPDGGLDHWMTTGYSDPESGTNLIVKVELLRLKPKGTFDFWHW